MLVHMRRHAAGRTATGVELVMPVGQLSTRKVEQLVSNTDVLNVHCAMGCLLMGKQVTKLLLVAKVGG